jgi:hypothetical protein
MERKAQMARKKVVTTEEIDEKDIQEQQLTEPEPLTRDESELVDYLETLGTTASFIKIYKIVDGQHQYCATCEPSTLTEDTIRKEFGGGRFRLLPMVNGKAGLMGAKNISIYQRPDLLGNSAANAGFNGTFNAGSNVSGNGGELIALREQINRQHEMILTILQKNETKQPDMLEMIRVMKELQPPEQKPPDITGLLAPIMGLFEKSMELAQNASAGEDSKMGWFKIISQSIEKLPGMLSMMIPKKNGVERMETVAPEVAAQQMLTQGIAWLKKKALAGKDADLQVEVIADNLEDPNYRNLAVLILNQPFESFGQIDPEIMQEPLKSWFRQVYDGLKEVVANEHTNALAGESGSAADAPEDEGTNN